MLLLEIEDYIRTHTSNLATAAQKASNPLDGPLADVIVAVETAGLDRKTMTKEGDHWPFSTDS